ncbi:metal-dependent hydrolase [Nonomuraea thailandensis]
MPYSPDHDGAHARDDRGHRLAGAGSPLAALPLLNESSRFIDTGIMATALSPAELIAGAIICAGAAMLPDLDHPSATIAQTFGPLTWGLSKLVSWISGGHRGATHSLVFAVALGLGAHWLADTYPIGRDIMVVLLIGLALRAIGVGIPGNKIGSIMVNIGMTAGLYAVFMSLDVGYAWLGLAVGSAA